MCRFFTGFVGFWVAETLEFYNLVFAIVEQLFIFDGAADFLTVFEITFDSALEVVKNFLGYFDSTSDPAPEDRRS